ncbi:MAG: endonuclease III domain-containing protein [Phycisphaerae bacterium]
MNTAKKLMAHYETMLKSFSHQHWWPGDTPLEIMIGAVLTQNTNWKNVELAINNLKRENLLDIEKLVKIPPTDLAQLIKPAGYFTVKTKRLQNLIRFVWQNYKGDLGRFFDQSIGSLREELLSVSGVGPETADDIILYAAQKPTFVVDAYTYRIALRHHFIAQEDDYQTIKDFFESNLPADVHLYNEYHALLVAAGKNFCKRKIPLCDQCPLNIYDHNPNLPEEF